MFLVNSWCDCIPESAARYNGDVVPLIFKVSWIEIECAAGEYAANYTKVLISGEIRGLMWG